MEQNRLWGMSPRETRRRARMQSLPAAPQQRSLVLSAIKQSADGLTDEEGAERLGIESNSYRPRRKELEQAGLIRPSGRTRETRRGRKAVVWIASEGER